MSAWAVLVPSIFSYPGVFLTMTRVAILGATGYSALELIKLLLRHPQVQIAAVTSRQEGNPPIATVHPSLVKRLEMPLEDLAPEAIVRTGRVRL